MKKAVKIKKLAICLSIMLLANLFVCSHSLADDVGWRGLTGHVQEALDLARNLEKRIDHLEENMEQLNQSIQDLSGDTLSDVQTQQDTISDLKSEVDALNSKVEFLEETIVDITDDSYLHKMF